MYFIILFACSLLVVGLAKLIFKHDITRKELLLQLGVAAFSSLVTVGIAYAIANSVYHDYEVRNGYVTGKSFREVSCEHQYVCGQSCSTDSDGNTSCVPIYCDEHSYDVDWYVDSTIGSTRIQREDRQGLTQPKRWLAAKINEPYSDTFSVKNYTKIDKLMYGVEEPVMNKYKDKLPRYPSIHDYYRIDRVVGVNAPDVNSFLNDRLRLDGALHQLNVIVVVTTNDVDYFDALMHEWHGGKKNDVVLVYGVDDKLNIKWARSNTLANGQDNQVLITKLNSIEQKQAMFGLSMIKEQYKLIEQNFKRLPNETFEYMADTTDIPTGVLIGVLIVNLIINIAFAVLCIREDL